MFTVPTVRFQILYVFVVVALERRRMVFANVTTNPTAFCLGQQTVNAFPWNTAPKFLIRDRDRAYGCEFSRRVRDLGILGDGFFANFRSGTTRTAFTSPSRRTLLITGRLNRPSWARSSRYLVSAVFITGTPAAQPEAVAYPRAVGLRLVPGGSARFHEDEGVLPETKPSVDFAHAP